MSDWIKTYDPETRKLHVHRRGTVIVDGEPLEVEEFSLEDEGADE